MQIPEHLQFHSSRGNLIYVTALKKIEKSEKHAPQCVFFI
ncbi:hypothetical protein I33_1185 [Bacillus subtilis subsp. subtilis str. RO-NN-1]|nr:hypothetical protein I33_1185 [Bacillus subtilis subsp. subtilis str. RO-NN-1]